jgi:NitT/TauT family transport system substrate-binding protein
MIETFRVGWGLRLAMYVVLVAACSAGGASPDGSDPEVVRLGYFANVTHAPAIVGIVEGLFQEELGEVDLQTSTFNAGTDAIEALFSGAIDMTFIGANPAINAFAQSGGEAVRIVAGTTSGGAALVVAPGIETVDDLAATTIGSPSLGNTQDVALRAWLAEQGFETTLEGAGEVSVMPQANAQSLETFRSGQIQGAWVPEPWATRLLLEGGGHVLVDERDLWPGGQFVTTHLIVSTEFLEEHPEVVTAVLRGLIRAQGLIASNPAEAQAAVNGDFEAITGYALAPEVIEGAWSNLIFTLDPLADSLRGSAADAVEVGLLDPVDLDGIYALELLNSLLRERGEPEVGG